jgi:enoyl-CoA hydratase/carnithine racemase
MSDTILVQRDAAIATVVLNNRAKMNALSFDMWTRPGAVMRELEADEDLRCIVLRGAGDKAFAAGAPLVARWHKKFARRLADPRPLTMEERDEGYACFDSEDYRIGFNAFLAKQKPQFNGR